MKKTNVICISGIDTDIGKTIVTGQLGRYLLNVGKNVITQKICQTGCEISSEDILTHREIMGIDVQEVDQLGLTCPYIFKEPCSPHLAAELENAQIDCDAITDATGKLGEIYEYVLLEGVGGVQVPLLRDFTLLDYLEERKYPLILVSSSRLGSINHTLLALEALNRRGINVLGIVYNRYFNSNENIAHDSKEIFGQYLKKYGYRQTIVDLPTYVPGKSAKIPDFSRLFSGVLK